MSNLGKQVLVLNRNWQAINVMTVQKALVMMATAVATAMDFLGRGALCAKGVISDRHPNAVGGVGFMRHDFENFAFDKPDLIVAVGYELQEFAPASIEARYSDPPHSPVCPGHGRCLSGCIQHRGRDRLRT